MADSEEVNSEQARENDTRGLGERSERVDSGLTEIKDDRLTLLAAKWQRGRWETEATEDEIKQREALGRLTIKERAMLTAHKLLTSDKARSNGQAIRAIIQMERQNQVDQLSALNSGTDPQAHGTAPAAPDAIALAMDASIPDVAAG